MTYSNIYIRSQNKSSFFLVVLAALSIFSFSVFYFGSQSVPSRASKKTVKKLQIVNLYINQAGIYWQSELKEFGWIIYGKQKNDLQRIALDERDSEQKRNKFSHHLVLLRDLDKNTTYYYKIIAGNEIAVKNNGEPYSFKTPQSPISNTQLKPLYGKVMLPNGQPASNALALLYYKDMVPLATVVKTTGEWLLPLQSVIDSAFSPLSISENDWVTMQILSEESEPAIIEAPIKKMTPVSNTIITGKTYRFTDEDTNVLSSSTKQSNENYADIDIVLPREGTIVPAVKPLLKGIALPKQEVDVSLDSRPPFSKRIITDEKGEWKLTLPIALLANSYTLTALTRDTSGKIVAVKRKFVVAKSGEQVLGEATGEATMAPTMIPTEVPQPTIEQSYFTPTPSSLISAGVSTNLFTITSLFLIVLGAGFLIVF